MCGASKRNTLRFLMNSICGESGRPLPLPHRRARRTDHAGSGRSPAVIIRRFLAGFFIGAEDGLDARALRTVQRELAALDGWRSLGHAYCLTTEIAAPWNVTVVVTAAVTQVSSAISDTVVSTATLAGVNSSVASARACETAAPESRLITVPNPYTVPVAPVVRTVTSTRSIKPAVVTVPELPQCTASDAGMFPVSVVAPTRTRKVTT